MAAHDLVADDDPDVQGIDQHVVRRPLHRQRFGERHLRRAADRGRGAVGSRRLRADVEDADDAAPFALFHLREEQAAKADLRKQFQVEIGLPLLVGQLLGRAAGRLAGIVDKDVDLAELGHHPVIGRLDRRHFGHVAADRRDLPLGAPLDLTLGVGQGRLVAREDRDIGPRGGELLGDCQPQPLAAAGDDRAFSVQSHFHVSLLPSGECEYPRTAIRNRNLIDFVQLSLRFPLSPGKRNEGLIRNATCTVLFPRV